MPSLRARRSLLYRLLAVAALLAFFALALNTAGAKAITTDEPLHLARGIAMHQTGTLALADKHAPLVYRLAGRLLGTEAGLPPMTALAAWDTGNPYDVAQELVSLAGWPLDRAIWLGRVAVVLLGVVLGALLAAWTRALTGHLPATGVVLALYALSPNLLAAAALLTTDMATTVTIFAAVVAWWRAWRRPGRGRWLVAAVALGLALAAKLTGALLLPLTLVLGYVAVWPARDRRPALVWLAMLPVAGLTLWALYGFAWGGLPMPAYWQAWRLLLTATEAGHANFFLGQVMESGSPLYLPVTLLLKTPPLTLALLLLAPVALWRGRRAADGRAIAFIVLPAALLLAATAASGLNYGYRYALPAVPFLMVLGGLAVPWLWPSRAARAALLLALGLTAVVALRTHPDHLAYFNALARGRGHELLGDSNLDWGQDANQLGEYARAYEAQTGRGLRFSYSGAVSPAHYGLSGVSLVDAFRAGQTDFAPANPPAGRYGLNVADLQGTGLRLGLLTEIDLFDWFRRREPLTTLGGSIFVYDVAAQADGTWVAHCATPGRLLDDAAAEALVGRAGLRHVTFDCATSWVLPDDGAPGWYVLPAGEPWIERWLGSGGPRVVYRHRANAYGPDYAIAYWPGGGLPLLCAGIDSCGDGLQSYAGEGGGAAQLRGFGARGAEWVTVWQVAQATAAPLSVQAHLLAAGGSAQVADGLGYAADQWQPGDWFVQRHLFAAPGVALETGLYNYITLERVGPAAQLRTTNDERRTDR